MSKASASLQAVIAPYQEALSRIDDLDVTLSHLRHKKTTLEKDLLALDERLATVDRERPGLLEQVLAGGQPESVLVDQENLTNQLKAEGKSKKDLLDLIATQIEGKVKTRTDLRARLEPLRRRIFGAIQEDMVANVPGELLPFITSLAAISTMNHTTWISIIESLLPRRAHNDWEKERSRILEEYGVTNR